MIYKQVKDFLQIPKQTVYTLIIYSLLLGFFSLTIPVSVQTLINLVGLSLVVSIMAILAVMLLTSFFIRLLQLKLVEQIQRKMFVDSIFKVITSLYLINFSDLNKINVREKLNRVFEIKIIQKTLATVFIVLLDILLQTLFCVIILAFYHPLFLAFDIVLIVCIFLSIFVPLRAAYKAGITESTSIYDIVSWFEEKPSEFMSFRQRPLEVSMQQIDKKLCGYLDIRSNLFGVILRQHIYIGLTYIFINVLLIGLGGYLIIVGQLSIGQLIAAELLVNIVLIGLVKFSHYLNDGYGFLVGIRKVLDLLDLAEKKELRNNKLISLPIDSVNQFDIKLNDVESYSFLFTKQQFNHLILPNIKAQKFLNSFFDDIPSDVVKINGVNISNYSRDTLNQTMHVISGIEVISGTVLDNLCEGDITPDNLVRVSELLSCFNISHIEKNFDDIIDSQTIKYNLSYNSLLILKMNVIRVLMLNKKLLVLIDSYDIGDSSKGVSIYDVLKSLHVPVLVIGLE